VSPIRLFILGAFDERGPMHGHQLRLLAEEERIHLWADVSVGALYGAIKRLANEGLIHELRVEREGSYPERQVFDITAEGRAALTVLREEGLRRLVLKNDPFDLAVTRLDRDRLDQLPAAIQARIDGLTETVAEQQRRMASALPYLTVVEVWVMEHRADRIRAEIDSHERLLAMIPEIVADELTRKVHHDD
jgi:DNA-binding PadR family transcriptional regulator